MHQAVIVTTTHHALTDETCCASGHRSIIASPLGLAVRFSVAAVLLAVGVSLMTSFALMPVAWTMVSVAAGIVAATFLQHAKHLRGVCDDCDDATAD